MVAGLRLSVELVPSTSWYSNLRKAMPQSEWDRLRRKVYADYGHKCGICGAKGRMNCHEIWVYNDDSQLQTLSGFIALCDLCHHVKHIGLAGILAAEGKLDYEKVVKHFMEVNDCGRKTFDEHKSVAFEVWRRRSRHSWTIALGEYESLISPERLPPRPSDGEIAYGNLMEMLQEIKHLRDQAVREGAQKEKVKSLENILIGLDTKLSELRAGQSREHLSLEDFMR